MTTPAEVEAVARAMIDCHEKGKRTPRGRRYGDWLRAESSADKNEREFAVEWMAARRKEARAAIAALDAARRKEG